MLQAKNMLISVMILALLIISATSYYPDWLHGWTEVEYSISGEVNYGETVVNVSGFLKYKVLQDTTDNVLVERILNITYDPENVTEFILLGFYSHNISIWINKFSREYMIGRDIYKTALWIERGLRKGNVTTIWNIKFEVIVDNIIYETEADGFEKRGALKLIHMENIGEETVIISAFYDRNLALLLGMKVELENLGGFEIKLSRTNIGFYEMVFSYLVLAWILAFSIGVLFVLISKGKSKNKF